MSLTLMHKSTGPMTIEDGAALVSGVFSGVALRGLLIDSAKVGTVAAAGFGDEMDDRLGATGRLQLVLLSDCEFHATASETLIDTGETEGWTTCETAGGAFDHVKDRLPDALRIGGDPSSSLTLILTSPLPAILPPTRVLRGLPPAMVGGLSPFLSAIGAEPFAVMDSLDPLHERLADRGPDCVAVLSRAGAFLWTLDLKGRSGAECRAPQRIDEDVVLPLTAGLESGAHVSLATPQDDLLGMARAGEMDVAFLMTAQPWEALADVCGHALDLPDPFEARLG